MASDIQAFALPYSIELRSIMLPDDFPVWIFLIACLYYMFFAASVFIRLEFNFKAHRKREPNQLFFRQ